MGGRRLMESAGEEAGNIMFNDRMVLVFGFVFSFGFLGRMGCSWSFWEDFLSD